MTSQTVAKRAVPSLFILVLMISVGPFGDTLYTPSLPDIAKSLDAYYNSVQLTITSYLAGYAVSQLGYGPVSDRFGRKPVMIFGAILFVAGSLVCTLSFDITSLICGRFFQGLGASCGAVISSAAVRDAFSQEEQGKVFAKMNLAFAIAPGLGPIVGSFVADHFSWHINFVILLALSLLLLILVIIMFPETLEQKNHHALHPKKIILNYMGLFRASGYLVYVTILGISLGMVYSCLIEAPALVIDIMHLGPNWFLVIAFGIVVAFMVGSALCNFLVGRIPDNWILFWGMLIMVLGSAAFVTLVSVFEINIWILLCPVIFVFIGIAFIIPIATMRALSPFEKIIGTASAMVGFYQMIMASLITGLVTFVDVFLGKIFTMPCSFLMLSLIGLFIISSYIIYRKIRYRMR
jgi:Bcr/CflA subfamily drug resistance transporter